MSTPLLATKLYIPPPRPDVVRRSRLIDRLNADLCEESGLGRKLTLISAPAGFGKTTLISEWIAGCARPVAWLSLDEGDNELSRFLTYLIAALQTVIPQVGEEVFGALQSPQPPPAKVVLTILLNDIAALPEQVVLVLDDYHEIEAQAIDDALTFLIEHLPPQLHLVITTREDPPVPLARLRARRQLNELRAADLRFMSDETADFLNRVMGLKLSADEIAALEMRTEGWIAGLQLAALALQGALSVPGHNDTATFIDSFSGSHRFVMDYLIEEVLQQQSATVQTFLLHTAILNRLCGPLCDAVLGDSPGVGQDTLEHLEQANLFLVPLDGERRWYRYHHLFAELLRQRLRQSVGASADQAGDIAGYHRRASVWYEENGFGLEAFHHATLAHDVQRAARLIEGDGEPLYFRGATRPVLNWLTALPVAVLDANPALWVMLAWVLTVTGQQIDRVEDHLQTAEAILQGAEPDAHSRDLIGQIATIRALLAGPQAQIETMMAQSQRALELLSSDNLPVRTLATWASGLAHQYLGERAEARQVYTEAVRISQASGNVMVTIAALTCLGQIQEAENQLHQAQESYQRVLELVGDPPWSTTCEAMLGLARLHYQWDDLDQAEHYAQQGLDLGRQIENTDTPVACGAWLARLQRARGDLNGAASTLAEAEQLARQHNFLTQMPLIMTENVRIALEQGHVSAAAQLAQTHDLPLSQAQVYLTQGDYAAALDLLDETRHHADANAWRDEQLQVMILQAIAYHGLGEMTAARQHLDEALALAAPDGFIRIFVDEGPAMQSLLSDAAARGVMPDYTRTLLAAFDTGAGESPRLSSQPLIEPLSDRELEILRLVASGLSNRDISERLYLALSTVKGHNRNIFDKLQVKRRTEAVARAQELGLL